MGYSSFIYHTDIGTEPSNEEVEAWKARVEAGRRVIAVAQGVHSHITNKSEVQTDDKIQADRQTLGNLCRTLLQWTEEDVDKITDLIDPSLKGDAIEPLTKSKGVGEADAVSLYNELINIQKTGSRAERTMSTAARILLRQGFEGSLQTAWRLEELATALSKPETEEAERIVADGHVNAIAESLTPTPVFINFADYLLKEPDTTAQSSIVDADYHRKRIDLMTAKEDAETEGYLRHFMNTSSSYAPSDPSWSGPATPAYVLYDDKPSRGTTLGTVHVTRA